MSFLIWLACSGSPVARVEEAPPVEAPVGAPLDVAYPRRTTSGETTRESLDLQIAQLHSVLDTVPTARAQLVEALVLRASLFGSVRDLDHALAVAGDGPERATALMAVHRFDDALAIDPSKADAVRLARHVDLEELEARRRAEVAQRGTTATWAALGDVLLAQRRPAEADAAYAQALMAYRDVSPITVSRIQFRRGLAWGERGDDPARARALYADAVARLPGFVRAQVHLAELEHEAGETDAAIARVRAVVEAGDPEPGGKLATWLPEPEASEWHRKTTAAYDALLAAHPLAFANHAAEYFAAVGDARRARDLAAIDLANRRTPDALELCDELGCL